MITAALPVAAHQNFAEPLIDFSGYSDTASWNGSTVTVGVLPTASNGSFTQVSAQSAYNGITNGVASDGASYGNSVKLIQRYNSSSSACSGIKYTPASLLYNTIHLETSVYMESASDGNKILRGIYLRDGSGSSNIDAQAITFRTDSKIYTFNSSTSYTWSPDSWYDVSMLYNMNTEEYKVTVYKDGDELFEKSGTHTAKDLNCITELQIRSQTNCKSMTTAEQIFYVDNFSLNTDFEFANPVANNDRMDVFDFSDLSSGAAFSEIQGGLGSLYAGQGEFATVANSEKGTALSYTYKGTTEHSNSYISHDIDTKTATSDAYWSKASFMLRDYNFKEIRFRHFNDNSKRFGETLTITPTSTNILGTNLKIPGTSENYIISTDKWVDFALSFNPEDGHIKAYLFDGTYRYVVESDTYATADYVSIPMYRTRIMYYNGLKDGCESSTMLVDDVEIGYIDNMYDFSLVEDASTTGPNVTVGENDAVKAVFSNKINKESFSDASVTMPYNAGVSYTLSFPDDYTVQINFDKELGEHYHIAFSGVSDVYGNTLTDFIEFDMAQPPYITGNITFADSAGNSLRYLTPGTVTATVSAVSGDGEGRTANMWAALYNQRGELSTVTFETIAYTASVAQRSVSITVPDDGEGYKLKAGVWTDDLAPLAFKEVKPQVVIFKLDDLRYSYQDSKASYTYEDFVSLADWAEDEKVALAFGVICNTLEDEDGVDKSGYYKAIADMDASDYVEVWCHGYTHEQTGDEESGYNAEFNAPLADQITTLQKCANIVYEKTGVTLRTLGVPHNIKNSDTALALAAVPQFTTLIASGKSALSGSTFMYFQDYINMETSTGVLDTLDAIKTDFNADADNDYVMFQGHAGRWSDDDTAKFKELVDWLKTQNVVFMTPTEYYNFVK